MFKKHKIEANIIVQLCNAHAMTKYEICKLIGLNDKKEKHTKKLEKAIVFLENNKIIKKTKKRYEKDIFNGDFYCLSTFYKDVGLYRDVIKTYDNKEIIKRLAERLEIDDITQSLLKKHLVSYF